jgi:hypothetical protein
LVFEHLGQLGCAILVVLLSASTGFQRAGGSISQFDFAEIRIKPFIDYMV